MRRILPIGGFILAFSVAACGGGGGGSGSTSLQGGGGPGPIQPASVSGDMIAYQTSRGWNYHGNAFGQPVVTVSVYADPQQSSSFGPVDPLVMFAGTGTASDAFGGTKLAGIGVQGTASGYTLGSYVLLNGNGSVYSQGGISPLALLVPSTLTQGQSFTPYAGATATVELVGSVPGASACPTPGNGATVQYTFMGSSYSVSYVPGCGITQYVGNRGELLTLSSVSSYPSLGSQSVGRKITTLTAMDAIRSMLANAIQHAKWSPLAK